MKKVIGYSYLESDPGSSDYQEVSEFTPEETWLLLAGPEVASQRCQHRVWQDQDKFMYILRTCVMCGKLLEVI
jgi:hypothetical protein